MVDIRKTQKVTLPKGQTPTRNSLSDWSSCPAWDCKGANNREIQRGGARGLSNRGITLQSVLFDC